MLFKTAIRLIMSALAAASLCVSSAYAQNSEGVINAAAITTLPPFAYKDIQSGEFTGFNRDLFEAMANKIGRKVNWIFYSYQDLETFASLKTGRIDIYGGAIMTGHSKRRALGVSFIDFVKEPYAFYALKSNAEIFKTPAAMCGKRVAQFRGNLGTAKSLDTWNNEVCVKVGLPPMVRIDIDGGTPTAQLELKQGRVDLAMAGAGSVAFANMTGGDIYVTLPRPMPSAVYGMAFLNEKQEFGESLRKALEELIADGTYVQLLNKWHLLPIEDFSIGKATINAAPDPQ
ncbi:transporter substrate-binding domain-containing protein [Bradyrhizobium sp. 195]|uniref:transporter substrate-binding domain-containing protein n=1 Tax=Bradyrhizobium sp. 195 TaxID=2782662 RepID=UPI00200118E7|nr:transporter substrate-binding domain-containing protein [Bradyrhizobium sp. 195]UPK28200.1 transporter substrate-binding domain-containing protein [Bradyrhizobium sp. 195]